MTSGPSPSHPPALKQPQSLTLLLLRVLAGVSAINLAALLLWYHPGSLSLGATGGVWTALAFDVSEGIFYRPLFDATGYGGTRYLFLFFVLHGFLIRVFSDPVLTGFFLVLASAAVLNLGLYFLLREWRLERTEAAAFSLVAAAPISYQLLTLEILGEFLASGLNLWGIVLAFRHARSPSATALAASSICFTGAFLTKFSCLTGLASVVLFFFMNRRSGDAGRLLLYTAGGVLLALAVAYGLSEGRILASFLVFREAPADWGYALKFPLWLALLLLRDPFLLLIFGTALYLACRDRVLLRESFPVLNFFIVLVTTCVILTSRGTDYNHLLDLIVASVFLLAVWFRETSTGGWVWSGLFGLLAAGLVITWLPGTISIKQVVEGRGHPSRAQVEAAIETLHLREGPVLSENPLIPILMGRRPRVMDPFTLRLLAAALPEVRRDFEDKLKNRFYKAVVLMDFSGASEDSIRQALKAHSSPGVESFYGEVHFPAGFLSLLQENYEVGKVMLPYVFFFPREEVAPAEDGLPPGA